MSSAEDGIWNLNLETDELYVSPTFKKMLGYSGNDALGYFELWKYRLHPDDEAKTL